MRVVLDTNIIVSALIAPSGKPAAIIDAWLDGKFTLLTCATHVDEFAEDVGALPNVQRSPDPDDDFLLALSEAGKADYLVTGDKSGLLSLARHKSTRIVSAREFAKLFG